jgi:HEAT repeat protein
MAAAGRSARRAFALTLAVGLPSALLCALLLVPGRDRHKSGDSNESAADRVVRATAFAGRADTESVTYLMESLHDTRPQVRAAAAQSLGARRDPRVICGLIGRLEAETDSAAAAALVRAVGACRQSDVDPAVLARIADPSPMVRLAAVDAIGGYATSNAIAALAVAAADTNNSVRAHAFDRLAAIGAPAIPSIVRMLGEGNELSRISRIAALGRIGSDEAVAALVEVIRLHEPNVAKARFPPADTPVRVAAIDALALIGEEAADYLARRELDRPGDLAFKSIASDLFLRIQSRTGVAAVTSRLTAWKTMVDEAEWKLWTDMLETMGTPEARDSLAKLRDRRASLDRDGQTNR